jgi:hypothetical protein
VPSELRTTAGERESRFGSLRAAVLLFVGLLAASALLGFAVYRMEVEAARHGMWRQMQVVSRLRAREVEHWIRERKGDVAAAATGPRFALDLDAWLATGRITPAMRSWIAGRLERYRIAGDYAEIAIVRTDGSVLLVGRGAPSDFRFPWPEVARDAIASGEPRLSPLGRPAAPADPTVMMDAVSPLTLRDDRGTRVLGAMVFRIDPQRYLFPLLLDWPTASPSAESQLVELQGDQVAYLNELRHAPGGPLDLHLSAADPELIAAKAVRGERGIVEGRDYRGVPVLASIEPVEGTPWFLISKVDQSELYAPLRDYLRLYLSFILGAATLAALVARALWRGAQEAALRREHEATRGYVAALEAAKVEREKLIESLSKALEEVKTLSGIVPICAGCKRIRDDAGYWSQVETYVSRHTGAKFSHGVCPECARRLYPGLLDPE